MARVLAVVAIVTGTVVVGFNPNRWDYVLFDLPRGGHGIHLHDLYGMTLIAVGTLVLWHSPRAT
jgi:hypothetical protein